MATYEYRCTNCGKDFEARRPMSEASEPATCPACGARADKLPSVFASKDGYTLRVPSGGPYRGQGGQ